MSVRRHIVVFLVASGVVSACGAPPTTETASPAAPPLSDADIEATIDAAIDAAKAALPTSSPTSAPATPTSPATPSPTTEPTSSPTNVPATPTPEQPAVVTPTATMSLDEYNEHVRTLISAPPPSASLIVGDTTVPAVLLGHSSPWPSTDRTLGDPRDAPAALPPNTPVTIVIDFPLATTVCIDVTRWSFLPDPGATQRFVAERLVEANRTFFILDPLPTTDDRFLYAGVEYVNPGQPEYCGGASATYGWHLNPVPPPPPAQLRVTNTSAFTLDPLDVMFPNEPMSFGPVPAGATTDYHPVQYGVYDCPEFLGSFDQEVFGGTDPDCGAPDLLSGTRFTFILSIDPERPEGQKLQAEVHRDD